MNIDLSKAEPVKCKNCEEEIFRQEFKVVRFSLLTSPTGKEEYLKVDPRLVCCKCNTEYKKETNETNEAEHE